MNDLRIVIGNTVYYFPIIGEIDDPLQFSEMVLSSNMEMSIKTAESIIGQLVSLITAIKKQNKIVQVGDNDQSTYDSLRRQGIKLKNKPVTDEEKLCRKLYDRITRRKGAAKQSKSNASHEENVKYETVSSIQPPLSIETLPIQSPPIEPINITENKRSSILDNEEINSSTEEINLGNKSDDLISSTVVEDNFSQLEYILSGRYDKVIIPESWKESWQEQKFYLKDLNIHEPPPINFELYNMTIPGERSKLKNKLHASTSKYKDEWLNICKRQDDISTWIK